ncbi:unnamed protein product [Musa acuminata subsp. burmannicoides]
MISTLARDHLHPLLLLSAHHHHHLGRSRTSQAFDMGEHYSPAAAYIRLVQHLIETCLLWHMSMEECMEALLLHADVSPAITSTVWKELEKENQEFFRAYRRVPPQYVSQSRR